MANMSYCRFNNTEIAVEECIDELYEGENPISEEEQRKGIQMFKNVFEYLNENDVILTSEDGIVFDDKRLKKLFLREAE